MYINIDDIYFDLRIRDELGDLDSLKRSIIKYGQLQEIIVADGTNSHPYDLVGGERRFTVIAQLHKEGKRIPGLPEGKIRAETRDKLDEVLALEMEFHENEDRKDFTWQEKCSYVKRIHDMHEDQAKALGIPWTVDMTAEVLEMGKTTVYKYLQLGDDKDLLEDPDIAEADSFNTAYRKATIKRDRKKRKLAAEYEAKKESEKEKDDGRTSEIQNRARRAHQLAGAIFRNEDARDFLMAMPDNRFDYFHWDPPYGGEQEGGAFTVHEKIDDSAENSLALRRSVLPEIFRTLKDGRWLAYWHHQGLTTEAIRELQGHELSEEGAKCFHCGKLWQSLDLFKRCPRAEWGFWVNPYPYIWLKTNRKADGHDIKRFSLNQYETFLLAAKWEKEEPILIDSSKSNVLQYPMVAKAERRHVMHKTPEMLADIIRRISQPHETGGDCSAGSGSIVEAAIDSNRKMVACELSEHIHDLGVVAIERRLLASSNFNPRMR